MEEGQSVPLALEAFEITLSQNNQHAIVVYLGLPAGPQEVKSHLFSIKKLPITSVIHIPSRLPNILSCSLHSPLGLLPKCSSQVSFTQPRYSLSSEALRPFDLNLQLFASCLAAFSCSVVHVTLQHRIL